MSTIGRHREGIARAEALVTALRTRAALIACGDITGTGALLEAAAAMMAWLVLIIDDRQATASRRPRRPRV